MIQTKKVLAVVLAALMVLLAMPTAAFADTAENAAAAYVNGSASVTAHRGDSITVEVNVTAAAATTVSVALGSSFDSSAFEFVSGEWLLEDSVLSDVDEDKLNAVITFENAVDLNGAAFRYVLRVKDAAAYADYSLQPAVRVEQDLAVNDVAVSAAAVTVAADPADIFTVAEDFEDINVTGTEGAYQSVQCTYPYGKALYFGRGASSANATITFDKVGAAEDAAVAFWFDTNGSGHSGAAAMSFIPMTSEGVEMCMGTAYTYYTVIDGVVAEAHPSGNFTITLPTKSSGWVIMPLPASGTWHKGGTGTYYGTCQDFASVYLEYIYYANASMIIDQISFVHDLDGFKTLVAGDEENIPGYTGVGHNFANGVCSACGTNLLTGAQDFESATDSSYVNGVVSDCGTDFGQSVVFSYNADLGSGTASNNFQHIAFDTVGTINDEALVFYYDNTTSGKNAVLYFAPTTAAGAGTTIKTGHPVTTIINGEVTVDNTSIINSNYTMTLPANSSGWVMLQIGRNGTGAWSLWGGTSVNTGVAGIAGFAVRTNSTTTVALDQFGFVKSMDAFAAYAANNANMPGYTGKQHTWTDATCSTPKTCEKCGITEGDAADHNWVNGTCSACGVVLYTIAENFNEAAVIGTDGAWSLVNCVSPYGQALKFGRESAKTEITVSLDKVGTADDKAIIFYYDNTMSGNSGEAYFNFTPYTSDGSGITLGTAYTYYVINDGVVSERHPNSNFSLRLPNDTAGWVILPLPADGTWVYNTAGTYYGTTQDLASIYLAFPEFDNASVVIDQIGFAADIDLFEAQVISASDALADYEGIVHVWGDANCTTPKTCEKCGATDGDALGHSWTDATCTAPKTCSVCGETEGEALGHSWTDATCTAPKTCSVCGETEGEALGHSWTDATCTAPKTCSVCGETEGEALGHTWSGGSCSTCGKAVYNTVVDFGDKMNTNENVISGAGSSSIMRERLVWNRGDGSVTGTSFVTLNFAATGDATEEAIILWIDSTKVTDNSAINFLIYDTNGSRCLRIAAGAAYQFVAADGTISDLTTNNAQYLPLVNDAKGWYVIPFSSFEPHWSSTSAPVAAGKVNSLYLALSSTYGDVLTLDDISLAVDTEAAVTALSEAAAATKLIGHLGASINEAQNALRFGFTLETSGMTVDGYQRDITNATVTVNGKEYPLVDFGAIVSNSDTAVLEMKGVDGRTKNIVAEKVFELTEDGTALFACGIKNIPAAYKDALIYARPYYIYFNGVENVIVYGDEYEQSINGYLDLLNKGA